MTRAVLGNPFMRVNFRRQDNAQHPMPSSPHRTGAWTLAQSLGARTKPWRKNNGLRRYASLPRSAETANQGRLGRKGPSCDDSGVRTLFGNVFLKPRSSRESDLPMKPMADSWDHAVGDETELAMDARTADPERSMKRLRGPALFFNTKVGWSRLGVLLSLAIIAIALVVPYRVAALSGFTSYAVGHNVGASVFSGGAVRYRIYSAYGLSVIDVTKICFIAGLTFWLGNATVLGLGVLFSPQAARALDQLPLWSNRLLAVAILAMLAAYVAWVWVKPRVIGREGWQVTLPGGPLTLLQIVIGIIDLACCAAAMYMLVPDEPNLGFVTVAVIFVAATLLGFASH